MVKENGDVGFVGGPVDSVEAKAKACVIVVPGDLAGKELFKYTLKVLAGKMPKALWENVLKISIEEIREFIPYGRGGVLEE